MPQQFGAGLVEVARALRDREPVAGEGRGAEQLPVDAHEHVAADEGGDAGARPDDEGERGQQAAGAAGPEPSEADAPLARVLGEQQRGDEVAAHDEEHVDPDETARREARDEVVAEHEHDGEGPHPVETGKADPGIGTGCRGTAAHRPSRVALEAREVKPAAP